MKKRKPKDWGDCNYCEDAYESKDELPCAGCTHNNYERNDFWTPRKKQVKVKKANEQKGGAKA